MTGIMAGKMSSYQTVETSTATIRFTGGVADDSDSSSDEEIPDISSKQHQRPKYDATSNNTLLAKHQGNVEADITPTDPWDKEQRTLNSPPRNEVNTMKPTLQLCEDSDSSTLESLDTCERLTRSSQASAKDQSHQPAVETEPSTSEQKLPTMASSDSGFSTWSASGKQDKASPASDTSGGTKLGQSLECSKDESQESTRYRQQLERMRSQRFNPFDADDPLDVQDPFPQLSDVLTARPSDLAISGTQLSSGINNLLPTSSDLICFESESNESFLFTVAPSYMITKLQSVVRERWNQVGYNHVMAVV